MKSLQVSFGGKLGLYHIRGGSISVHAIMTHEKLENISVFDES
jgi:hypothetical protein